MNAYCIGLDLGTSFTKAVALSSDGTILASVSVPNRLWSDEPGTGWQDPREVWGGAVNAISDLTHAVPAKSAVGICLSGAMHSLFPAGADGSPLLPASTWADVRAGATADSLQPETDSHELYKRTGCPLSYLYYPAKIRRWLDQTPHLQKARFAAIKDFVLYQMTGIWATDMGLASGTGMMDIQRYGWDEEALALAGITIGQLPVLIPPMSVAGYLTPDCARITGLTAGLPVVAGAGDGGLANLGAGAYRTGETVITVGTSAAVRRISAAPVLDDGEKTWCYVLMPGHWYYGGATNNAGLAVQWVRERFYPDLPGDQGYRRLFSDVYSIPPGADGVIFAPYFTGERNPYWDAEARAMIYGLKFEHYRQHIARAIVEGVGFCLADIWDSMGQVTANQEIRLNGIIVDQPGWAQILSDQLGVRMNAIEAKHASAVGAGILGLATLDDGCSLEELTGLWLPKRSYDPESDNYDLYRLIKQKFVSLYGFDRKLRYKR